MARVLSGYNPERLDQILGWHLRDALLSYEEHYRLQTELAFRHAQICFAILAPHLDKNRRKPPKLPEILKA